MKLKEIHWTSTFTWSPSSSPPLIATGMVAGALGESFSSDSQLEIWAPNFLDKNEFDLGIEGQSEPKGAVKIQRGTRLTWGYVDSSRPRGVTAAGMENNELELWDPAKILYGAGSSESLILRNANHTRPVRALDFNSLQTRLLSSDAVNGEVCIWDLKDPTKLYAPTPGFRSTKLDSITSVAWNQQVPYVLAGASTTGYTVVWDLRGKREVVALAYGGGAGTLVGQVSVTNGLAVGGRRWMSAISRPPANATRLVTTSEDDSSPIIMVWDLRDARALENILTGHKKGNPQTSEIIGELPSASNWAFQVEWCPRNPDLLATAFFDGTVDIHSIQSTNEPTVPAGPATIANGVDAFDSTGYSQTQEAAHFHSSSRQNGSDAQHRSPSDQSAVVHLRKVVTELELIVQTTKLNEAIEVESLKAFAEEKADAGPDEQEAWKALLRLFQANSRDELVTLCGFSMADIPARSWDEEIETEEDDSESKPHEPVVSFTVERSFHVDSDDDPFEQSFPPDGTLTTILDWLNRAESADSGSTLEIQLDAETSQWLQVNYDIISNARIGKLEAFDETAIIKIPSFIHAGISRVVQNSVNSRADSLVFEMDASRALLGPGGAIKFPTGKSGGSKKRGENEDVDDDVVVEPQPIIVFESAFGEAIKRLRFNLLQLCLGMESVRAWAVGFKIRGDMFLTGIQVLVCYAPVEESCQGDRGRPAMFKQGKEMGSGIYLVQSTANRSQHSPSPSFPSLCSNALMRSPSIPIPPAECITTVPLRACCLSCYLISKKFTKEAVFWEETFSTTYRYREAQLMTVSQTAPLNLADV
ncbi:WD40-repeat-containing domain protein [Armillaria fumosa]|nr:WD40-repeat-containing domain protein [Armillaria fumosa]